VARKTFFLFSFCARRDKAAKGFAQLALKEKEKKRLLKMKRFNKHETLLNSLPARRARKD
jgi:hypothetical protein